MAIKKQSRRTFLQKSVRAGVVTALGVSAGTSLAAETPAKRVRVGVIGCGNISPYYIGNMLACPYVELVSACDIRPERAAAAAERFMIPNHYPHIERMLTGVPFDLLVNLTDIQEHEHLNREAVAAWRHVWSEKPLANSLAGGQQLLQLAREKNVHLLAAPTVVNTPQFEFMARTIAAKKLGRIAATHASYGHGGPNWSAFFYEEGAGSMPDLGVYNVTTLTGLLGPARSVVAMTSVVTPTRVIQGEGEIRVTAEDNAMLILDHGPNGLSHVQSGFNYFTPQQDESANHVPRTITLTGSGGTMSLVGHDHGPHAVELATTDQPKLQQLATDAAGYTYLQGAAKMAEMLVTGKRPRFTAEHALHVVEVICAARESQATGRRIVLQSTFRWPIVAS